MRKLGAISFLRTIDDNEFTINDKNRMLFLSKYISKLFVMNLSQMEDQKIHNRVVEEYANLLSIGMLVIEQSFHIRYYNTKAWEICIRFAKNDKYPIQEFIEQTLLSYLRGFTNSHSFRVPQLPTIYIKIDTLKSTNQFIIFLIPVQGSLLNDNKSTTILAALTQREIEIADLLMRGLTNNEIAEQLFISINTVKRHVQNIYQKLEIKNRTELGYYLQSTVTKG
ncbi:response regulator transcription factor [Bacillus sp. Marseille-P3661]|uniref:response regulator transcription factor n=1 Tax=Bacillus sp. Marseille-P3661 TaxID=1936234 RepID=UPI00215545E5|nr:helix-turn-helix transcriptional regulator [Bacillus sp. Marseille-P3661]